MFNDGLYIYIKPTKESVNIIKKLTDCCGCSNDILYDKLHTTIISSREKIDVKDLISNVKVKATITDIEIWQSKYGNLLVLELDSDDIRGAHFSLLNKYNITSDNYVFIPHITLFYYEFEYDKNVLKHIRELIGNGIEIEYDKVVIRECIKQKNFNKLSCSDIYDNIL